jgi:hypothetical protein
MVVVMVTVILEKSFVLVNDDDGSDSKLGCVMMYEK